MVTVNIQPRGGFPVSRPGYRVIHVGTGLVQQEFLYREAAERYCDYRNSARRAAFAVTDSRGTVLYGKLS